MMLILAVVGILTVAVGYVCAVLDQGLAIPVKRLGIAVVVALALSTVLYAAEAPTLSCNDYEKYSFLWYANFCFLNEHSS